MLNEVQDVPFKLEQNNDKNLILRVKKALPTKFELEPKRLI